MKYDSVKVNNLLKEMELILERVRATNKGFQEALAKKKKQAA